MGSGRKVEENIIGAAPAYNLRTPFTESHNMRNIDGMHKVSTNNFVQFFLQNLVDSVDLRGIMTRC